MTVRKYTKFFTHFVAAVCMLFIIASVIFFCTESTTDYLAIDESYIFTYYWHHPDTGYMVCVDDWADLLTDDQEGQLFESMKEIAAYGHVAFVSINENNFYNTERYIENYYYEHFGSESGTVFLIDMDYRYIWIHSNGAIYRVVTDSYADIIADNAYSHASSGDYYECADVAFGQILSLLKGQRIAQPMKYISNALLAIALALLINYGIVMAVSRSRKAAASQLLNGIYTKVDIHNTNVRFLHQSRRYSPIDSGGGGGGGHGGGGGGGGHSGGGGGGHKF